MCVCVCVCVCVSLCQVCLCLCVLCCVCIYTCIPVMQLIIGREIEAAGPGADGASEGEEMNGRRQGLMLGG